jgi:hypothetical protein
MIGGILENVYKDGLVRKYYTESNALDWSTWEEVIDQVSKELEITDEDLGVILGNFVPSTSVVPGFDLVLHVLAEIWKNAPDTIGDLWPDNLAVSQGKTEMLGSDIVEYNFAMSLKRKPDVLKSMSPWYVWKNKDRVDAFMEDNPGSTRTKLEGIIGKIFPLRKEYAC